MSGPKDFTTPTPFTSSYTSQDWDPPAPSYDSASIRYTKSESEEVIAALASFASVAGVSYSTVGGRASVQVEHYASVSISEIEKAIAEAKVRAAEKRAELLRAAKEREREYADRWISRIEADAKAQCDTATEAKTKCLGQIDAVQNTEFDETVFSVPDVTPLTQNLKKECSVFDTTVQTVEKKKEEMVGALVSYKATIDGCATMEEVERTTMPDHVFPSFYNEDAKNFILSKIALAQKAVHNLKEILDEIKEKFAERKGAEEILAQMGCILANAKLVSVQAISDLIAALEAKIGIMAQHLSREAWNSVKDYLQTIKSLANSLVEESKASAIIGSGSDATGKRRAQLKDLLSNLKAAQALSGLSPTTKEELTMLHKKVEDNLGQEEISGKLFSTLEEAVRTSVTDAKREHDAYIQYARAFDEWRFYRERAKELGMEESSILLFGKNKKYWNEEDDLRWPEGQRHIVFLRYATDEIQKYTAELAKMVNTRELELKAEEIILRLTNFEAQADQMRLFSAKTVAGGKKVVLTFTKQGDYGTLIEYTISNGKIHRELKPVSIYQKVQIKREALIERMETRCEDAKRLLGQMKEVDPDATYGETEDAASFAAHVKTVVLEDDEQILAYLQKAMHTNDVPLAQWVAQRMKRGADFEEALAEARREQQAAAIGAGRGSNTLTAD